jgi:acylphosphatase
MLKAVFYGKVQGVGFRFTAKYFAEQLKANGYVKNLEDGTVELVCDKIELIEKLKDHYKDLIKDIKIEKLNESKTSNTSFRGFFIAY